eukprot:gene12419-biopygen16937
MRGVQYIRPPPGLFCIPGTHFLLARGVGGSFLAPQRAKHVEALLRKVRPAADTMRRESAGGYRGGTAFSDPQQPIPTCNAESHQRLCISARVEGERLYPAVTSGLAEFRSFQRRPQCPGSPNEHGSTAEKPPKSVKTGLGREQVRLTGGANRHPGGGFQELEGVPE